MQSAVPSPEEALSIVEWPLSEDGTTEYDVPVLTLEGPATVLRLFLNTMDMCAAVITDTNEATLLGTQQLWPIFILSRGRSEASHLNWALDSVLGTAAASGAELPVVAVVSPEEKSDYRRCWPGALLLSLPESGRALGYGESPPFRL